MVDLTGKSLMQDWQLARERLERAARDRKGASFDELVVYEGPPSEKTGLAARTFVGVMTWQSAAETLSQTRFFAMAFGVGFADLLSDEAFEQLLQKACRDYPGKPFDPAST